MMAVVSRLHHGTASTSLSAPTPLHHLHHVTASVPTPFSTPPGGAEPEDATGPTPAQGASSSGLAAPSTTWGACRCFLPPLFRV